MKSTKGTKGSKGTKKAKPAAPKRRRAPVVAKAGRKARIVAKAGALTVTEVAELENLRMQLRRTAGGQSPLRWNADPDEVRRSVAQLVLTLVEFVRKLLERQSIRRMEAGTLTDRQVEDVGRALMQLEETVREIAAMFAIPPEDLNLDVGPLGKLI
jgi:hypothetical protein